MVEALASDPIQYETVLGTFTLPLQLAEVEPPSEAQIISGAAEVVRQHRIAVELGGDPLLVQQLAWLREKHLSQPLFRADGENSHHEKLSQVVFAAYDIAPDQAADEAAAEAARKASIRMCIDRVTTPEEQKRANKILKDYDRSRPA